MSELFLIRPFRCHDCHSRLWKFVSPNSQIRGVNPTNLHSRNHKFWRFPWACGSLPSQEQTSGWII